MLKALNELKTSASELENGRKKGAELDPITNNSPGSPVAQSARAPNLRGSSVRLATVRIRFTAVFCEDNTPKFLSEC